MKKESLHQNITLDKMRVMALLHPLQLMATL
jgi:hypothetical protein